MQPMNNSAAFPKTRRLILPSEFARVRTDGQSVRGPMLVLVFFHCNPAIPSRTGFVTSKRVGGAVVRNRIRRRLRNIVRTHQAQLRDGFWLVLIARPAASAATFSALKDEWLRLAERASILAP